MKMRKLTKTLLSTVMAATCAISSIGLQAVPVMAATGDVAINSNNFKDFYFRKYVSGFDKDENGILSVTEREAVTKIDIQEFKYSISDLSGIKFFPNVVDLVVRDSYYLETLDLTPLSKLEYFDATSSNVKQVDFSNNLKLRKICLPACSKLESLDVTNNLELEYLDVQSSKIITSIDVRKNTKLTTLIVTGCSNVTSLDLSNNAELLNLVLINNSVTSINLTNNPKLVECYNNPDRMNHYKYTTAEFDEWQLDRDPYSFMTLDVNLKVITDQPIPLTPLTTPVVPTTPSTPVTPATPTTPVTPVTPSTPALETGLSGFIERLYNVALGRSSEAQGKNWWINKVKFENYTGSDVANGFLVSDEFLGKQMSNDQFLEVLYKTFFDRTSDAQGKAYWLNLMANGYSKSDVINGFCNSTEWANLCLTYGIPSGSSAAPTIVITPNEGTNAFVTRLYTTCLGRAPEQAGFEYWTYRLANMQERGSSAAYGFFTSPEFTGKGYDNATYVTLLYRTILGREPDQAGLNYWLGLMNGGMSRENVLNGFAASTEWADICSSYGILK